MTPIGSMLHQILPPPTYLTCDPFTKDSSFHWLLSLYLRKYTEWSKSGTIIEDFIFPTLGCNLSNHMGHWSEVSNFSVLFPFEPPCKEEVLVERSLSCQWSHVAIRGTTGTGFKWWVWKRPKGSFGNVYQFYLVKLLELLHKLMLHFQSINFW